jgi:multicomponent Na+:H+ antiporter subunit E
MSSMLRVPSLLVWLTALWVALWGDLTVGNMVSGLLVAIVVVVVARPTGVTGLERTYFRPGSALIYGVYFLIQMVKSNLIVAWEIITPGLSLNRAIIKVPMHTSSAGVVALVANSVTLTPGTVTIEVIEEPADHGLTDRTLFIHVLHFLDVDSVHRDVLRLERLAIKAFGSRDELQRIDAEMAAIASSTGKDLTS